jgi:hypothetical protein
MRTRLRPRPRSHRAPRPRGAPTVAGSEGASPDAPSRAVYVRGASGDAPSGVRHERIVGSPPLPGRSLRAKADADAPARCERGRARASALAHISENVASRSAEAPPLRTLRPCRARPRAGGRLRSDSAVARRAADARARGSGGRRTRVLPHSGSRAGCFGAHRGGEETCHASSSPAFRRRPGRRRRLLRNASEFVRHSISWRAFAAGFICTDEGPMDRAQRPSLRCSRQNGANAPSGEASRRKPRRTHVEAGFGPSQSARRASNRVVRLHDTRLTTCYIPVTTFARPSGTMGANPLSHSRALCACRGRIRIAPFPYHDYTTHRDSP